MDFTAIKKKLSGEIHYDDLTKVLFATDASIYKELPLAVAFPKNREDIILLIEFARNNQTYLIPRATGTSLAGQCVGDGIVVDISKYMNRILEINVDKGLVWVEPGVIRDELNRILEPTGLFFAPNTSTSNRATVGGMFGNNSCGTTSIEYGSTRENVISAEIVLSDGSVIMVGDMSPEEVKKKCEQDDLEGNIYRHLIEVLSDTDIQSEIATNYPDPKIHRRNQGYALDMLLNTEFFGRSGPFSLSSLLAGSEGTLGFTTRLCLKILPLPKPHRVVVAPHFETLHQSMLATQVAMNYSPSLCELMDDIVISCTEGQPTYEKYRRFIKDLPSAVLLVEFRGDSEAEVKELANRLIADLKNANLGYYYPLLYGDQAEEAFLLRKAGLGLIANIKGDAKPVACIEDTAVALDVLPEYIADFQELMKGHGQRAVFYAHAGAGELHLRPILNLKTEDGVKELESITSDTADLVKKYNGTLSGEHGDGRVRAAFLNRMIGEKLYAACESVKDVFDPDQIFNRGKIVRAKPMTTDLRYDVDEPKVEFDQAYDYFPDKNMMDMVERCNGSGDCRRLASSGAAMCPSYMVTMDESASTRGRANALREFMKNGTGSPEFTSTEIMSALDLCISCKACKSECPSNVDMSLLKAEYQYQYYKSHPRPKRDIFFTDMAERVRQNSSLIPLLNLGMKVSSTILKNTYKIAPKRSLPSLDNSKITFPSPPNDKKGSLHLYIDEFLGVYERDLIRDGIALLHGLGYEIKLFDKIQSGRSYLSKSMLDKAADLAEQQVLYHYEKISADMPLVGIEPSPILSFRDEYPRLLRGDLQSKAKELAHHCLTIEEFIMREVLADRIDSNHFDQGGDTVFYHSHCHQKALSDPGHTVALLELPRNNKVIHIPSACCGMAGSFGYEKEHYEVSKKMAELVLIPAIDKAKPTDIITASGISCRHQIADFSKRTAVHPIQYLLTKLKNE